MPQTCTGVAGVSVNAVSSVPKDGDFVTGAGLMACVQSIENDLATVDLKFLKKAGGTVVGGVTFTSAAPVSVEGSVAIKSGASLTLEAGSTLDITTTDARLNGKLEVRSGGELDVLSGGVVEAKAGSKVSLLGRVVPRSASVAVADAATKAFGVAAGTGIDYAGKRFILPEPAMTARVHTLKHTVTGAIPTEGETMEFIVNRLLVSVGTRYTFQREDATVVFTLDAPGSITPPNNCFVEVEFRSGAWHLGANSGSSWDPDALGAGSGAAYGVIPGAGA